MAYDCYTGDGNAAVVIVTNLDNGDTVGVCPADLADFYLAMLTTITETEWQPVLNGGTDAGTGDPTDEPDSPAGPAIPTAPAPDAPPTSAPGPDHPDDDDDPDRDDHAEDDGDELPDARTATAIAAEG